MKQPEFIKQAAHTIQRAYKFSGKGRRQGLPELSQDIDEEGLKRRDIFEFGIRLVSDGVDSEYIGKVLSNMINYEQDETAKRLQTIQKEAVLHIHKGINSWMLLNTLFSFLNDAEQKEVKSIIKDESFKDFLRMY